jgi:hypothetical protein
MGTSVYNHSGIGNYSDSSTVTTSLFGLLAGLDDHNHKRSYVYPSGVAPVTVTAGAGAYVAGNYAEIVPANTITKRFCLNYISIENISANGSYEITLYSGTTEIGSSRFTKNAQQDGTMNVPIQTDLIDANSQVQAKLMSSAGGGDTANVSLFYHLFNGG